MRCFYYHGVMSALHPHPFTRDLSTLAVLVLVALSLMACSPSKRIDDPPVLRLAGVEQLESGKVRVDLMLTNLNQQTLMGQGAALQMSINDQPWIQWAEPVTWTLSANAREVVQLEAVTLSADVQQWLDEVAAGTRPSVLWSATLEITLAQGKVLNSTGKGYLYRVPGSSNRFR